MPAWLAQTVAASALFVALCAAAGLWLLWRDRRARGRVLHQLQRVADSLTETSMGLSRALGEVRRMLAEMRWGRRQ